MSTASERIADLASGQAWAEKAEALADKAASLIIVRRDVFGSYNRDGGQITVHGEPTKERLIRHFRGEPGATMGAHSLSPDNLCKSPAIDIDAHEGDKADPEVNWDYARWIAQKAKKLGLHALIFDSNGRGGYHVRLFFKKPIPSAVARWLVERLTADHAANGFASPPEAFPKQAELTIERPYGNWLRLPGPHHKRRGHWTRIYDPDKGRWFEGAGAVDLFLAIRGDKADAVLNAYKAECGAREQAEGGDEGRAADAGRRNGRHRDRRDRPDEATVRAALDHLPASWADSYGGTRAECAWLGVGMALHDWDSNRGLPLWDGWSAQSDRYESGACSAKWSTFTAGGGFSVATIFHVAMQGGWIPPWQANGKAGRNGQHQENGQADPREPDEPPLDVAAIRARVDDLIAKKDIIALFDDDDLLTLLARLETERQRDYAAVEMKFRGVRGFPLRRLQKIIKEIQARLARDRPADAARISELKVNEAIDDPHRLARHFREGFRDGEESCRLVHHRDEFFIHEEGCYQPAPSVTSVNLVATVKGIFDRENLAAVEAWEKLPIPAEEKGDPPQARKVTRALVSDVNQALVSMTSIAHLKADPPFWRHRFPDLPDPLEILPARNGLVDLSREPPAILDHSPNFFSTYCLPYDYDPDAPEPAKWLGFLRDQWGDDKASIDDLHEQIGYLLTPDTSLQKIFLWIGPPRSGRSTIKEVVTSLIGSRNVAATSAAALSGPFGLESLLGKTVAIFGDSRTGDSHDTAILMDRVLRISGEDPVDVNRKGRPILGDVRLRVRLIIISNELPNFRDASNAITSRYHILKTCQTITPDKRNPNLAREIIRDELPGILKLAIEGRKRLRARKRFEQTEAGADLLIDAEEIASPVKRFADECLDVDAQNSITTIDAFSLWKNWAMQSGYPVGNIGTFGKNLKAAFPGVTRTRPRAEKGTAKEGEQVPTYYGIGHKTKFETGKGGY